MFVVVVVMGARCVETLLYGAYVIGFGSVKQIFDNNCATLMVDVRSVTEVEIPIRQLSVHLPEQEVAKVNEQASAEGNGLEKEIVPCREFDHSRQTKAYLPLS